MNEYHSSCLPQAGTRIHRKFPKIDQVKSQNKNLDYFKMKKKIWIKIRVQFNFCTPVGAKIKIQLNFLKIAFLLKNAWKKFTGSKNWSREAKAGSYKMKRMQYPVTRIIDKNLGNEIIFWNKNNSFKESNLKKKKLKFE